MTTNKLNSFIERVFSVDVAQLGLNFKGTRDRTIWYKFESATKTLYMPDMGILRVNPMELSNALGAVESLLKFGPDTPLFNWDNLELYEYKTPDGISNALDYILEECKDSVIAVDIETKDLSWDGNNLLAIGFAIDNDTALALYDIPPYLYSKLEQALNMPGATYAWHNGKFDCTRLWYCCGIKARIDEDTELKHFVQINEQKGTHKLKSLGPIYLQAPKWDDELDAFKKRYCRENKVKLDDFKYSMIPTSILIPYLQRDCIATRRLLSVFNQIAEPGTGWIYKRLIQAANVFVQVELTGAYTSSIQIEALHKKFSNDLNEASRLMEGATKLYWNPVEYVMDTGAKSVSGFNSNSPKQLLWMLQKLTGKKLQSTDAATVEAILKEDSENHFLSEDARNFIKGLAASRVASKYLDTYVIGMSKAVCKDGRVRGSYNLHGTETGRLSSSKPNMQNIPRKNKDVKSIFVAENGYKLVQLDYSQAELRVLGVLSGDEFLIQSYRDDADLHANVARKIFGDNFTSENRSMAKTVNFGQ